jgi:hypothetical protein
LISEDDEFEYYRGYKVPKHYTIPPDYSLPSASEETTTTVSQTQTESLPQKQEKKFPIDPLTEALITAGMIARFGGVMAGRKSKEEVKPKW